MSVCTFFGHRDCPDTILPMLRSVLIRLIEQNNTDQFYVGNQGRFDSLVRRTLRELKESYPHIRCTLVLAYLPQQQNSRPHANGFETLYPEGIERAPLRFSIAWRNRWMLRQSDIAVIYVAHPTGGAAHFAEAARRQNKLVINLAK